MSRQHPPGQLYLIRMSSFCRNELTFLEPIGFMDVDCPSGREAAVLYKKGTIEIAVDICTYQLPTCTVSRVKPERFKCINIKIPAEIKESVGACTFREQRDCLSEREYLALLDEGVFDAIMRTVIQFFSSQIPMVL